jgi:gluconolactonase
MGTPNYPLLLSENLLLVTDSGSCWGSDDGSAFTIDLRTLEIASAADDCRLYPNGLVLAADGRSIFMVESRLPGVVQYDLMDGRLWRRRVVVQMPGTVPDGLAIDAMGTLYIACWRPDRIYRLTAAGVLEVFLDDPTAEYLNGPTNLCFGQTDMRTLFIGGLGGWKINAIDVDVPGLPQGLFRRPNRSFTD